MIVLVSLTVIFIAALIGRGAIGGLLLDWTGENNTWYQIRALSSTLFQRPIDTDDLSPVAYAGVNPFGVNTFFEQEVEDWKLHMSMQLLRTAGAHWVRQEMPWSDIEINGKGDYKGPYGDNWAKYDRFIALAGQYDLNIVARLDDPPNWTRQDNSVHNRPPDNYEDYGDFVYAFVSRYKGQIKYYQIWNEPNIYPEWGNQAVNAKQYVALLKVAYKRAKEADPDAVILCAGLAPTFTKDDGTAESDLTYLQKMYDAGAGDYFDIMSAMGYSPWSGPGDRRADAERVNFSRLRLIREIMVRNGDAAKSVWVSEVGFDALPDDFPGPPTHGKVTREEQATYTELAYKRAIEEWPWVGVVFYWHLRMVHDENRNQVVYYFGMTDTDFTIHPVYFSYMKFANEPPVLHYGYRQEDDRALTYRGTWQ
ncbi:MAG: hypothetical protein Q7O66_02415, partial [Dehalococcoidia bacterium]|nr:hypothetical protein [Dehalococcoidia bacterium]